MSLNWFNAIIAKSTGPDQHNRMAPMSYICGYCDNPLSSGVGYWADRYEGGRIESVSVAFIYICHHCGGPTYFGEDGKQTPGSAFGGTVEHIPSEAVEALYEEARDCMQVSAYTAAILCCRKLLMNIAVAKGADENKGFAYYVNYLADEGYLPPGGKEWVDLIRKKGNEATHEIAIMEQEDAEELITFSEMLLRFIYEYPARIRARVEKSKEAGDQT